MSKNKKVMSIAIKPELHEELKKFAKRKAVSASEYVGTLVEQAVKMNVDEEPMVIGKPIDEDIIPVVLKIPATLKGHPDKLAAWMEVQAAGIVKAMSKTSETCVAKTTDSVIVS